MRTIPVQNGPHALVSDEDYDRLIPYHWYAMHHADAYPASVVAGIWVDGRSRQIIMHRIVAGAKPGQIVWHKDGNRFNNQRDNLRVFSTRREYMLSVRQKDGMRRRFRVYDAA